MFYCSQVVRDGKAADAGLHPGDLITAVHHIEVDTLTDTEQLIISAFRTLTITLCR